MRICLRKNLVPLRASALARLDEILGDRLYALTASPIAQLRARKFAEAKAVQAGSSDAPLLRAEAEAAGIAVASLVEAVLVKAANATEEVVAIEVKRQAAQADIRAATNPAEIKTALTAGLE